MRRFARRFPLFIANMRKAVAMFTNAVRVKLARDYGIRDIPHELLEYFVVKRRASLRPDTIAPEATVAFLIASDWQRGLTMEAI